MGDTSGCQISSQNLAVYLQDVTVTPSSNMTSEYFVTASLPSSASLRRVWQFTSQGTITGPEIATLTLDYTQAYINCSDYNITFEGALNGLLTIHNQVFSANKFMSYQLTSAYVLVLTLKIPKSILECFGPGKTQNYSFSVYVNDSTNTININFQISIVSNTTINNISYTYYYIPNMDFGVLNITSFDSSNSNNGLIYSYGSNQSQFQIINNDTSGNELDFTLVNGSSNMYYNAYNVNESVMGTLIIDSSDSSESILQNVKHNNAIVLDFSTSFETCGGNLCIGYDTNGTLCIDSNYSNLPVYVYFTNIEPNSSISIYNDTSTFTIYVFGLTDSSGGSPPVVNSPTNGIINSAEISFQETITGTFNSNGDFIFDVSGSAFQASAL